MAEDYNNVQVPYGGEPYCPIRLAEEDFDWEHGVMAEEAAVRGLRQFESENNPFTTNVQELSPSPNTILASPTMTHDQGHPGDTRHPHRYQHAQSYYEAQQVLQGYAARLDASVWDDHRPGTVRLDPVQFHSIGGYDNKALGEEETIGRASGPIERNASGDTASPQTRNHFMSFHHAGWNGHEQQDSRTIAAGTAPDATSFSLYREAHGLQGVPSYHYHANTYDSFPYPRGQRPSGGPSLSLPSNTNITFSGRSTAPWSTYQAGQQQHQPSLNAAISRYMDHVPAPTSRPSSAYRPDGDKPAEGPDPAMTASFNSDIQDLMQSRDTIRPENVVTVHGLQAPTTSSDQYVPEALQYDKVYALDEDNPYYDFVENAENPDFAASEEYELPSSSV